VARCAQNHAFEVNVVANGPRRFQAIQLLDVQLAVGTGRCAGNDAATQVGKQFAAVVRQGGGLLQDAGAAGVIDDVAALFLAGLEHQLAIRRRQFALHTRLPGMGRALARRFEQLAAGEKREEGDKQQGTSGTHHWVSRQVSPRYSD
jgi:hypothetical protein